MSDHSGPVERKATLFCPACSYSGHIDDEWRHRETGIVVCPDCHTRVATHRLDSGPTLADAVRVWNHAMLAPWRVWRDSVERVELP